MRALHIRARDRRAILFGAAVLLPALLYTSGVRPYLASLGEARGRLVAERELLSRELRLIGEIEAFRDLADQAAAVLEGSSDRLFAGVSEFSESAALIEYVGDHAERQEVLLQSSESRGPIMLPGEIVRLAVEVRGMSDLEGVLGFVDALDHGEKLIRIESIDLQRAGRGVYLLGGSQLPSGTELLEFSAVIAGYARDSEVARGDAFGRPGSRGEG